MASKVPFILGLVCFYKSNMPRHSKVFSKRPKHFFGKRKREVSSDREGYSDDGPTEVRPRPTLETPNNAGPKTESSSKKKVGPSLDGYQSFLDEKDQCYDILSVQNLNLLLNKIAVCSDCGHLLSVNVSHRLGLSAKITIECTNCCMNVSEYNDMRANHEKSELNTRLVYGFRCIGKGEESAKTLCGVLYLPSPPAFKYYSETLHKAVKEVMVETFKKSVEETVVATEGRDRDGLCVAFDGSWQRRGHRSLNGVVSAVGVNSCKVLDARIFSKHCRCKNRLKKEHEDNCTSNDEGV